MKRQAAEIVREYGPFAGVEKVNGVTYDGRQVWFASGDKLNALDAGMFRVDAFHLYCSELTPAGPVHTCEMSILARKGEAD